MGVTPLRTDGKQSLVRKPFGPKWGTIDIAFWWPEGDMYDARL